MSLSSTSWGGVVVSIYSSVRSGSLEMRKSLTKELMTSNAFERRCVFLEAPINASCANGLRHELTHLVATEEQTAPVGNWVGDVVAAAAAAAADDDDDDGDIGWHHVISTCTHTHTHRQWLTYWQRQTDWLTEVSTSLLHAKQLASWPLWPHHRNHPMTIETYLLTCHLHYDKVPLRRALHADVVYGWTCYKETRSWSVT